MKKIINPIFFGVYLVLSALNFSQIVEAEKLCVKRRQRVRNNKVPFGNRVIRTADTCPRRWVELIDTETFRGENGQDGQDGQDAPSIYGDGSAGNVVISVDRNWTGTTNYQFENLTINAGQELLVASGTIIRCRGNFINNGDIIITDGGSGGRISGSTPDNDFNASIAPHAGLVIQGASNGSYGSDAQTVDNGEGGSASILLPIIASKLYQGAMPAGAGGAARSQGASAGGAVYILCNGDIENNGTISANGKSSTIGSGGGAGGYVVLASASSVTNSGNIEAAGGSGGASGANRGAGGGGGGGVIVLAAPSVDQSGILNVSGGPAGSTAVAVTTTPRFGGGGGGAFGGRGGDGASVSPVNTQSGQADGANGRTLIIERDPGSIF